jgi:hypothetical protein
MLCDLGDREEFDLIAAVRARARSCMMLSLVWSIFRLLCRYGGDKPEIHACDPARMRVHAWI